MMNRDKVYFQWVMFNGKVFPRKQYGPRTDGAGKEIREGIAYFKLLDELEVGLNLDELAKRYPYERKQEDAS